MSLFRKKDDLTANFILPTEERASRQTVISALIFACIVSLLSAIGANASYRASTRGTSVLEELSYPLARIRGTDLPDGTSSGELKQKDRMNILLLGIGGEGHSGPQLTDTIIVATADLKEKRVGLVSLPRDLAYPLGGGRFEKINAVNAYNEKDHPGEGAMRTAQDLSTLLDTPIDHVIRIDFAGFAAFIDALGGVDIDVERTFYDPQFPTEDERWKAVSFKKGPQHMDGDTALTYARSRHGNNGEGSDFARSRRQQLVLLAVREKLLSLGTLTDRHKLAALYTAVTNHIQTDMNPWDALQLAPLLKDFSSERMTLRVLTDEPGRELSSANVNGAFMLFPRKPDWSNIRDIVQDPFTIATSTLSGAAPIAPAAAKSKIEIKNGTTRTGFAAQMAAKIELEGFEVKSFGNAIRRGYEETVIYDLTNGKKPQELAKLKKSLNAIVSLEKIDSPTTDGLAQEKPTGTDVDFFVILGEASYPLLRSQ